MNDKTVINKLPMRVTAHNGTLSQNPLSSIAFMIDSGKTVSVVLDNPDVSIIFETMPCTISKSDVISSSP